MKWLLRDIAIFFFRLSIWGWLYLAAMGAFNYWLVTQIITFAPTPCGFHEQCYKPRR